MSPTSTSPDKGKGGRGTPLFFISSFTLYYKRKHTPKVNSKFALRADFDLRSNHLNSFDVPSKSFLHLQCKLNSINFITPFFALWQNLFNPPPLFAFGKIWLLAKKVLKIASSYHFPLFNCPLNKWVSCLPHSVKFLCGIANGLDGQARKPLRHIAARLA